MMYVALIVVLWKVCYNSQSQDVLNIHAKIETNSVLHVTSQYEMWNEVMLWFN